MSKSVVCVVSIDNAVWGVASSWRNAYRMMCEYFASNEHDWALDTIEPELADDKFAWMNTETGEVEFVTIDECVIDDSSVMPFNKWEQ